MTEAVSEITAGVKITRNRMGHFHMHIPITTPWDKLPSLEHESKRKVVALDPGVRVFQTFYSPGNDFGGYAIHDNVEVLKEANKYDDINSKLKNENLSYFKRERLRKSKYRSIARVRNLVSEVHKKVANDLCKNYDTIMLPNFESQKMVKKPKNANDKPRKIGRQTARAMLNWRHYEFRQYLASKVIMRGNELVVVTEEYTTQCCGKCGHLNKNVGSAEVYKCCNVKCKFQCGRDENAARNIFLKYLYKKQ